MSTWHYLLNIPVYQQTPFVLIMFWNITYFTGLSEINQYTSDCTLEKPSKIFYNFKFVAALLKIQALLLSKFWRTEAFQFDSVFSFSFHFFSLNPSYSQYVQKLFYQGLLDVKCIHFSAALQYKCPCCSGYFYGKRSQNSKTHGY